MFPPEILEIFFRYSDGIDVLNFRCVCKTWNSIITRLSKDTNFWQIKCQKEIPLHYRRTITEKLYPKIKWNNFHQAKDNSKWLYVYQSWIKWHRINEFSVTTEQFEPFFIRLPCVQITCLSVSENLLALGSSGGLIAVYNVDSSIVEPIFIADQMEDIADIKFLKDKRTAAISISALYKIMLWDIELNEVIDTRQYGRLISTTNELIWITLRNKLIIQNRTIRISHHFPVSHGTIIALVTDGDQGFLWTDLGYSYTINLNDSKVQHTEAYVKPPAEQVENYYLFQPQIAMCITKSGYLGISVKNTPWIMYETLSVLHGTPTAVLFYANILVLGLDSGSVYMYYVDAIESLATLDFKSKFSKAIIVDNQAIIALDIMDRPHKQHLIAATSEKVNVIELKN